jgi:hypothetical protein
VARHRQDAAVQPLPAAGQRSRALASLTQRFTAATALPDEVLRAIVRHQIQEIAGPARANTAPRTGRAGYPDSTSPASAARTTMMASSRPPSPAAAVRPYCLRRPAEGPVRRDVGPWRGLP